MVRTGHGTMDCFQIGKGVCQGCILSPFLFNLHAEYIMWNAELDEAQAGIKIAARNTNKLRYADDVTLMAQSKDELETLDKNERGKWKSWLKTQHSKNKDHGIRSHHFTANDMGKRWKQWEILFLGVPKSLQMVTAAMKLKGKPDLKETCAPQCSSQHCL